MSLVFQEQDSALTLRPTVMLFYDMALTFGDEVEKIWKQRFTGATVLWSLVRSLIMIAIETTHMFLSRA